MYLARCGVGSRRHCEELIRQGRVAVNQETVSLQGLKVGEGDRVSLDGKALSPISQTIYLALHKPSGYLCANEDSQGRPLASELFAGRVNTRLFHIGRLDFLSSGLIFYTNDGQFARLVSHPSSGIEKEYLAETRESVPESLLQRYQAGIRVEGEIFRLRRYAYRSRRTVLLTLVEGKNREIRKVFQNSRLTIRRIQRTRIGCVSLRDLPLGAFRRLTAAEVRWFFKRAQEKDDGGSD